MYQDQRSMRSLTPKDLKSIRTRWHQFDRTNSMAIRSIITNSDDGSEVSTMFLHVSRVTCYAFDEEIRVIATTSKVINAHHVILVLLTCGSARAKERRYEQIFLCLIGRLAVFCRRIGHWSLVWWGCDRVLSWSILPLLVWPSLWRIHFLNLGLDFTVV